MVAPRASAATQDYGNSPNDQTKSLVAISKRANPSEQKKIKELQDKVLLLEREVKEMKAEKNKNTSNSVVFGNTPSSSSLQSKMRAPLGSSI